MGKSPKNRKSGGRVTEKGTRPKPSPSSKKKRVEESTPATLSAQTRNENSTVAKSRTIITQKKAGKTDLYNNRPK